MAIQLYNTQSRTKEAFLPIKKGAVSMYNCGPTVYDTPHIGNYRTFVMNDLIRRVFEYSGYAVTQAMNITDVDDKTLRKCREQGLPLATVTQKYEALFLDGLKSLNVLLPHHILRATDSINEMIALITTLLDKGIAYKADDGVYVSIEKVKDYGSLARLKLSGPSKERVTNDEYDKENPRDFAVWKFKMSEDGDVSWKAPFGEGRPGWHIECSAMAMKVLGETIDIHTGGSDLIFPHHVNEIAQSESATGKPFVHYWLHGAFVTMNDEKMAKSKGNVIKLEDLDSEVISPLSYRYLLLTAHYRSPLNVTKEALIAAQTALMRLLRMVSEYTDGGTVDPAYKKCFAEFVENDLDLPQAVALAWEILKDAQLSDADKRATLIDFDKVFGLNIAAVPKVTEIPVPEEVRALSDARELARTAKDWAKADALRIEIENRGFTLSDTPEGIKIRPN